MPADDQHPKAASAEIAPEDLDLVVGGRSGGKTGSPVLSQKEEQLKRTDAPGSLAKQEEGVKRQGK